MSHLTIHLAVKIIHLSIYYSYKVDGLLDELYLLKMLTYKMFTASPF